MPEVINLSLGTKYWCYYLHQVASFLQVPYKVVKPIGEVDFMINMHDRGNKH